MPYTNPYARGNQGWGFNAPGYGSNWSYGQQQQSSPYVPRPYQQQPSQSYGGYGPIPQPYQPPRPMGYNITPQRPMGGMPRGGGMGGGYGAMRPTQQRYNMPNIGQGLAFSPRSHSEAMALAEMNQFRSGQGMPELSMAQLSMFQNPMLASFLGNMQQPSPYRGF